MPPTHSRFVALSKLQENNYHLIDVIRRLTADMRRSIGQSRVLIRKSRDAIRDADDRMARERKGTKEEGVIPSAHAAE